MNAIAFQLEGVSIATDRFGRSWPVSSQSPADTVAALLKAADSMSRVFLIGTPHEVKEFVSPLLTPYVGEWVSPDSLYPPTGEWHFDDMAPQQGGRSSDGVMAVVDGELALVSYEELTDDGGATVSSSDWVVQDWAKHGGKDIHRVVKPTLWLAGVCVPAMGK